MDARDLENKYGGRYNKGKRVKVSPEYCLNNLEELQGAISLSDEQQGDIPTIDVSQLSPVDGSVSCAVLQAELKSNDVT